MTKSKKGVVKLIYNPYAGFKRRILPNPTLISLEEIKGLLNQYQIPFKLFPTKFPGHATILANDSLKEGFKMVIVAGGDGTVGEAANGLINTKISLGILPLGSFMNVARMLSIPQDLEKAVELIKIGRIRKIDAGYILKMGGKRLSKPHYFIESSGIGLEAQLHQELLEIEQGKIGSLFKIIWTLLDYWGNPAVITMDKIKIKTKAIVVNISNGPFSGVSLPLAPKAKLNDHFLTVTTFKMTKVELLKYFVQVLWTGKRYSSKITSYQAKKVSINTTTSRLIHADARVYGSTPVDYSILPNALNVITGFPKTGDTALIKRTFLDP